VGRRPNAEREAWEEARAIVSKARELHGFARMCIDPRERMKLHTDEHRLTLQALELVIDLHQRQWLSRQRANVGQLRLVA